jgi:hypothetical protein
MTLKAYVVVVLALSDAVPELTGRVQRVRNSKIFAAAFPPMKFILFGLPRYAHNIATLS